MVYFQDECKFDVNYTVIYFILYKTKKTTPFIYILVRKMYMLTAINQIKNFFLHKND